MYIIKVSTYIIKVSRYIIKISTIINPDESIKNKLMMH
jgi:hypothetical protein